MRGGSAGINGGSAAANGGSASINGGSAASHSGSVTINGGNGAINGGSVSHKWRQCEEKGRQTCGVVRKASANMFCAAVLWEPTGAGDAGRGR
eukprot:1600063-Rhodomonas_salina.1